MELAAPLARVDRSLSRDGSGIKHTLDVGGASGVVVPTFGVSRIGLRISFEVDVDGVATVDLIALVGTGLDVIGCQGCESKIA